MISKATKIFEIDGTKYQFDDLAFRNYFDFHSEDTGMKKGNLEQDIAESIHVSPDAVHNWRFGSNGPSSIELVKELAENIDLKDYKCLLKKVVEKNCDEDLSVIQIESVKRIYDAIIDCLLEFEETNGFSSLFWEEYKSGDPYWKQNVELYFAEKFNALSNIMLKEYIFLRNTSIYQELQVYLDKLFVEYLKLRFVTKYETIAYVVDDYNWALKNLNEIMERYI